MADIRSDELASTKEENKAVVKVLFVGAGGVNFGGVLGPWNHSKRLELLGGVEIVGIADPDVEKAQKVLEQKLSGLYAHLYRHCVVMADFKEAIEKIKPQVAFIGVPPPYHGSLESPLDIELQCLKAGLHIFIEKPVSVVPPEQFTSYVQAVEELQRENDVALSVGYMFRYHPAIVKMKTTLEEYGRPVMGINARYSCAYSKSTNVVWWNKSRSGGPVVEQATHFCDIMRYLVGEVDRQSISALAIPASDNELDPGFLSRMNPDLKESSTAKDLRVPRLTSAHWRFDSGAIGNLTHVIAIHGRNYETAIDVWADGLRMELVDPYFPECELRVRKGEKSEEIYSFPNADPYLEEDRAFLEAVVSGEHFKIKSTYEDAFKTYKLTWDVRNASEL